MLTHLRKGISLLGLRYDLMMISLFHADQAARLISGHAQAQRDKDERLALYGRGNVNV